MAHSFEGSAFRKAIAAVWSEDEMMKGLGYKRVEGLSFWVQDVPFWSGWTREYDRPFTKAQHRRHIWEQRRLRLVLPLRRIRRRFHNAWDAFVESP